MQAYNATGFLRKYALLCGHVAKGFINEAALDLVMKYGLPVSVCRDSGGPSAEAASLQKHKGRVGE